MADAAAPEKLPRKQSGRLEKSPTWSSASMPKASNSSNRPTPPEQQQILEGTPPYPDRMTAEEVRPARPTRPLHELLATFSSTDEVPPMDTAYWRRAGKVIAEAAAKKALFWRAKRKD